MPEERRRQADQEALRRLLKVHAIGLTGGVATGKSTVAALLAKSGLPVIDADQLARDVTAPGSKGLAAVSQAFGTEMIAADGSLDRRRLGALVFKDAARRLELERLTHPLIREALWARLIAMGMEQAPRPFIYEASLIYERQAEGEFRAVWATWCPPESQLTRLMARNGLDRAQAEAIVASQLDARQKAERADLIIDTSGSLSSVEAQVQKAIAAL